MELVTIVHITDLVFLEYEKKKQLPYAVYKRYLKILDGNILYQPTARVSLLRLLLGLCAVG